MSVVIDASITLAWYFEDEATEASDAVLDLVCEAGAVAPGLWRLEVANAFQSAIRRGRVTGSYRDASLAELSATPITIDTETDSHAWSTIPRLADRFGLTLYDATYLELAERSGLPLATLDKALRQAAAALGVTLLGLSA